MNDSRHVLKALRPIWPAIKWGVFLAVLAFVAWHAWTLWNRFDAHPARLHWGWIALAVFASGVVWLPSAWYWRWMMGRLGVEPSWPRAVRAYYCGTLGKYLPGKAAVIVIRAALLKSAGVPAATAALAVTHETLTCMWVGCLWAVLLYPSLSPHLPEAITGQAGHPLLRAAALACIAGGGAAMLVMLLRSHRLLHGVFAGSRETESDEDLVHLGVRPALRVTLAGGLIFLGAWWIQGLTLGLTIRGVVGERVPWSDWPFWTGTAAVSLVGGFLAIFAPGGLGVREGLLIELLERQLGPREAVLVTVLWRGASLASEILAAGALYYAADGAGKHNESQASESQP